MFSVKLILFALVAYYLYRQMNKMSFASLATLQVVDPLSLIAVVLLLIPNVFSEWMKWMGVVALADSSQSRSKKELGAAFFTGILSGFLTPNLIGNFLGRMYYFERKHRSGIVVFTLFSNGAQFTCSILFGIIALLAIGAPQNLSFLNHTLSQILLVCAALLLIFGYFRIEYLTSFLFKRKKWFQEAKLTLQAHPSFRLRQLCWSALRHAVFSFQYFLVFKAFGLPVEWTWILWIWQIYFWSTLLPSLWFGKLLIRESVALWLFAFLTPETELVLVSSVTVWLVNQAVPVLVGLPFISLKRTK